MSIFISVVAGVILATSSAAESVLKPAAMVVVAPLAPLEAIYEMPEKKCVSKSSDVGGWDSC
jgi:hypothetical protein